MSQDELQATPSWEEAVSKAIERVYRQGMSYGLGHHKAYPSYDAVQSDALTALNQAVKELVLASKPDWSKEEHADNNAQMAYAIGGKKAIEAYQANIIKAIDGGKS